MTEATESPPAPAHDRIAKLSLGLTMGVPLIFMVAGATQLRFDLLWVVYGIRGILILAAAGAALSLWTAAVAFRRRQWRRAISGMALPVAVTMGMFEPKSVVRACNALGSILNFELHRDAYEERVAALPATGQPKFAIFIRGGMPFFSEGIIYDESDEVALPDEQRSPAWIERTRQTQLSCGFSAHHVSAHYYIGHFFC
jgi:hypothetical protein